MDEESIYLFITNNFLVLLILLCCLVYLLLMNCFPKLVKTHKNSVGQLHANKVYCMCYLTPLNRVVDTVLKHFSWIVDILLKEIECGVHWYLTFC
jgi:hypothetical protein